MREVRIFSPSPLQGNSRVELEGQAAKHILQVRRMQAGQSLTLFDGSGGEYPAVIDSSTRNCVIVSTGQRSAVERESALKITLWHGLCRGERMDNVIQKATELGVHAIQPLLSERSVVKLDSARTAKKMSHWQGVISSACEQCGRNRLPAINAPAALGALLDSVTTFDRALLLDPGGDESLHGLLSAVPAEASLLLCSGPEGGFSEAEAATAKAAGMQPARMGPRILRTETAPLAALAMAQTLAGDMR